MPLSAVVSSGTPPSPPLTILPQPDGITVYGLPGGHLHLPAGQTATLTYDGYRVEIAVIPTTEEPG